MYPLPEQVASSMVALVVQLKRNQTSFAFALLPQAPTRPTSLVAVAVEPVTIPGTLSTIGENIESLTG